MGTELQRAAEISCEFTPPALHPFSPRLRDETNNPEPFSQRFRPLLGARIARAEEREVLFIPKELTTDMDGIIRARIYLESI